MTQLPKKIKVVIGINDFLVGGAQKLIVDQIKYFDRERFELYLITLFEFSGKSTFYHLLDEVRPVLPVTRLDFKSFWRLSSWLGLIRTLRSIKPDVVVSHLFFSNTVFRLLKPFFGYRVVIVEHNTYIKKARLHIWLDRLLAPLTFKIIAVSETVKDFTAEQEKIPKNKFQVILNGINLTTIKKTIVSYDKNLLKRELGFKDQDRLIINVGRLTSQKNQELLIDGFNLFCRTHDNYRLLILGEGSLKENLQAKITNLGLTDRVFLLGHREDVYRYYCASDFFVATSVIEGFGIAHVEAMCCGLPLLSTKTAGPDKMIEEGLNGYFIDKNTKESVFAGLIKMTKADLILMGEFARKNAQKYDISVSVGQMEQLVDQSLAAD